MLPCAEEACRTRETLPCAEEAALFKKPDFVVKSFQEVVVMLSSLIVLAESFKHDCTLKEFNFNGNYILRFQMDKNMRKRSSTSIVGWVFYFVITDLTRVWHCVFFSHISLSYE